MVLDVRDLVFQILPVDVMDAHRAAIDATGAGDRRVTFGDRDLHVLEAAIGDAHMLRKGVVVAAAVGGSGGSNGVQRQKSQAPGPQNSTQFSSPGFN